MLISAFRDCLVKRTQDWEWNYAFNVGLQWWACPLLWGCKRANWAFELKGPSNLCLVLPNLCPSVCLVLPNLWEIYVHVSSTMCKIWETYVVQFHWQYSEIVNILFIANLNASLHDSPHFSLYTSLVPPCPLEYCGKKAGGLYICLIMGQMFKKGGEIAVWIFP